MAEFLTVLAILVSVYSLLPEEKRQDIILRIYWFRFLIIFIPILSVISIFLSPVILNLNIIEPIDWIWGFDKNTAVFSYLLFVIIYLTCIVSGSRLPKTKVDKWDSVSQKYLRTGKFHQLGYLLDRYHGQLFDVMEKNYWYVRIHNYISPKPVRFLLSEKEIPFYDEKFFSDVRKVIACFFPSKCKAQDKIKNSISRLFKSKKFVRYLGEACPEIALKASVLNFDGRDEYVNSLFEYLLSDHGSILYRELRDNQNCSYTGEYYIDEGNQLLMFYFNDFKNAQKACVWQPVGEYIISYIKQQRGVDNFYNQPNDGFAYGDERWESPIFVACMFFNVMISRAIFDRVCDHAWLMYVDNFIKEILENIEYSNHVDRDREFPTKFDYLLYEFFSSCGYWAVSPIYLTYDDVLDYETLPEVWAAKTYGSMLRKIIKSDQLDDKKKTYYFEIFVRNLNMLDDKDMDKFTDLIISGCLKEYEYAPVDREIIDEIKCLYNRIDHVLKNDSSSLKNSLDRYCRIK